MSYLYSSEVFLGEKFETGNTFLWMRNRANNQLSWTLIYQDGKAIRYAANPQQGTQELLQVTADLQPTQQLNLALNYTYFIFELPQQPLFSYPISRARLSYQYNRYVLFRGIVEHNGYRDTLLTDLLASFTYIPGTVMHLGYGSIYQESLSATTRELDYNETNRGFFFKASYNWRK